MNKNRILLTAAAVLLCAALVIPANAGTLYGLVIKPTYGQTEARQMLESINELRKPGNAWYWNETDTAKVKPTDLKALVYDYTLEQIAMQRAAEIAVDFSHTRPDGTMCYSAVDEYGYVYWACGENIAVGQTTAAEVFEDWCETDDPYAYQGHRRNMLSADFTGVGIGHAVLNGRHYWVQEFGKPQGADNVTETAALNSASISSRASFCRSRAD